MDELWVCRAGLIEYREALALQERLRAARQAGAIPDTMLLLEHPPGGVGVGPVCGTGPDSRRRPTLGSMDRSSFVRLRWRLTGAWMWPTLLVLTFVDAAVGHWLPSVGDGESLVFAWIEATVLMVLAMAVITPPVSYLLRRLRRDLPRPVARNYAGTIGVLGVSVWLAIAGVMHRQSIIDNRNAMNDATQRAEAWIGDHAPPAYMAHLRVIDIVDIQAPRLYRACVPDASFSRSYCVVVDTSKPFGSGVSFDGHESNQLLEQGAN